MKKKYGHTNDKRRKYDIRKEYSDKRASLRLKYRRSGPDSMALDYDEFDDIKGIDDE